ncbi:hypothetical protein [Streptomyces globisporus]
MRGGWKVESGRGRDRLAGHFLHERNPVGRWERGEQHVQVRSINEWFDPEGADVAIVRETFTLMWRTLKREKDGWPDVVLMGSPSQTGRDLWTRTIPTREDAEWRGVYPVMSEEIRQLLRATSGQGRTELITPPRLPQQLPGFYEFDRTLAYGKHTWSGGVGAPRRVTARTFASSTEKEQTSRAVRAEPLADQGDHPRHLEPRRNPALRRRRRPLMDLPAPGRPLLRHLGAVPR